MEAEVVHTRYVVGGVYKQQRMSQVVYGVLIGSTTRPNGHMAGNMYTNGWAPAPVIAGGADLDTWQLVSEPIPSDILRILESAAIAVDRISALEARVLELETRPTPVETTVVQVVADTTPLAAFDPSSAVAAVRNRKAG